MLGLSVFVIACLLMLVTLLAKTPLHDWWVRACEFPRLQIAVLAFLTAILSLWAEPPWQLPTLLLSIAVVVAQGVQILPWTRLWPVQVKRAKAGHDELCVTVMVANVLTPNRNAEGLMRQIRQRQPDLILTLESDGWWQQQLDHALAQDWPHSVKVPLDNLYGMHLYSRLKLEEVEVKWLIQDDIPSIHAWLRLPSGDRVRLHAMHPRPPAPNESEESLWRDAELLLVGKQIHQDNQPTLVAGDLNDVAWSRTTRMFCRVSGMLDPRRGRGLFSTFHANYPLLRWPLDHIFVSEHFTLKRMRRLQRFGSDHFPIIATLCYQPTRASEQEPPSANRDEWQAASDTIKEAKSRDPVI
ncbi:endonuclease/exonuclease/phosphatase family protein [Marinobacter caseinilyticus]|uniref:endonuclease/exonuclease/phosphatase family protein n=1 Tax=Marinobacter caseinilyticus TaxID=2692195 RepID=UPI00140A2452|nr:endonuclease/exonuclease/phosphatase family protein [Marinobacter caseinilyticus]